MLGWLLFLYVPKKNIRPIGSAPGGSSKHMAYIHRSRRRRRFSSPDRSDMTSAQFCCFFLRSVHNVLQKDNLLLETMGKHGAAVARPERGVYAPQIRDDSNGKWTRLGGTPRQVFETTGS